MSLDGQYDDDNIFAKIIRGELPCVKVYEDENILSFMDEQNFVLYDLKF